MTSWLAEALPAATAVLLHCGRTRVIGCPADAAPLVLLRLCSVYRRSRLGCAAARETVGTRPAAAALECLPLLLERDALRRNPLAREELPVTALPRDVRGGAIGKLQMAAALADRHLPANKAGLANLIA